MCVCAGVVLHGTSFLLAWAQKHPANKHNRRSSSFPKYSNVERKKFKRNREFLSRRYLVSISSSSFPSFEASIAAEEEREAGGKKVGLTFHTTLKGKGRKNLLLTTVHCRYFTFSFSHCDFCRSLSLSFLLLLLLLLLFLLLFSPPPPPPLSPRPHSWIRKDLSKKVPPSPPLLPFLLRGLPSCGGGRRRRSSLFFVEE